MNIIFLDIDGVLNCQEFYEERSKPDYDWAKATEEHPLHELCPKRIGWLNELCQEVNAKVVISSTWRGSGIEYCRENLSKRGATFEIIDVTPWLMHEGCVRGNEILQWIKANKDLLGCYYSEFYTYAIIDDDSDMLLWQREHFFQTDNYSGLTPNTCYKIKRFFQKFNHAHSN